MKNVEEANNDESTRCIVLSAVGPVFSSGHNLKLLVRIYVL